MIELGCLLSLIAAPLFFNVHSDRVFEPDKLTLLRSIASLVAVVWVIRFIDQERWRGFAGRLRHSGTPWWRIPFVLPVLALVVVYLVSTLLSVTAFVSWAGSYQRLQGTFTTLSYVVIFAATADTLRTREQVDRFITAVILASIPVALYGMLQRFGLDPLPWGGDTQTRIAGHMGNAIFIAAYLIMAVPLTAGRIVTSFAHILTDEELNPADILRSSIYIFALAIQLIAIWWSGSRGPQLGLAVGLFAFILIFLVSLRNTVGGRRRYGGREILAASTSVLLAGGGFLAAVLTRGSLSPSVTFALFAGGFGVGVLLIFVLLGAGLGWKWLWLSWIEIALAGLIWLGAFNFTSVAVTGQPAVAAGPVGQTLEAWRALPGIGRLGSMLEADEGTGRVRVLIWEGALDLFTSGESLQYPDGSSDPFTWLRPLIGYGPEAMYVAYNRFYPPELGTLEARNASPDRSHNETWDALIITGVFGFVAWQWLYLSVFYYGFSWLGVVKTRRDQILLVALWLAAGALAAAAFSIWRSPVYIGVALPFGSIAGLVVYLIYYAVSARPDEADRAADPFSPARLSVIAFLGAILAHYVEIHFGIAIAATRIHFFVFAALLLLLVHILPRLREETEAAAEAAPAAAGRGSARGRRRSTSRRSSSWPDWLAPAAAGALALGVILATLAYNFTIFTPRPDQVIQSVADLPTTGQIFYDSFFVNPRINFIESPFIYLLFTMTWLLGSLILISELVRSGAVTLADRAANARSDRVLAWIFLGAAALFLVPSLIGLLDLQADPLGPTRRIGYLTLSPLGALAAGGAGIRLFNGRPHGRLLAAAVAAAGIALALPLMLTGGLGVWVGFLVGLAGIVLLFALWGDGVAALIKPALFISLLSLGSGFLFAFLHAAGLRATFLAPRNVTASTPEVVRRVAEADQFVGVLSRYYVIFFGLLLLFGLLFTAARVARSSRWATPPGLIAAVVLLPLAFWWINAANLEVIHADMIYKRGKEFDNRAGTLGGNPETQAVALQFWDDAIGIYSRALELTPREDFYYLWLGRAYLEKSALLDGTERNEILRTAERSLLEAQAINPLNTDHTANLARLNTRWATFETGVEQQLRLESAEAHYVAAIELSPQNSIIRNEYARMVYSFTQDCGRSLALYDQSIAVDPFFEATRFEVAEVAAVCALSAPVDERGRYLDVILEQTRAGARLARTPEGLAQRWLRTAQTFQQLGALDRAIQAYEEALPLADDQEPLWRIQYLAAVAYAESGNKSRAAELAAASLATAPPDATTPIQQFLDTLAAGS